MLAMSRSLQAEVVAFLSSTDAYPFHPPSVERHETHGAIVFLAGERAYKLKRAVRLPYMDYSTVELRRQMCLRELEVNRRMAPEIYIGVAKVRRRADGALVIAMDTSEAQAIDWLVVMHRFPQGRLLEEMRRSGTLSDDILRRAAKRIADFHAGSDVRQEFGGAEGISSVIEGNQAILGEMVGRPFSQEAVALLGSRSRSWLKKLEGVLEDRRQSGFVRRVHGDLHLNNICLFNNEPVPFDAIEFRDEFACIDTIYDLAFLLMDLDRHGLGRGANAVLNAYLEQSHDYGGLAPLPLFLACRAAIRAHVTISMARENIEPETARDHARAFLDRALAYLQPPPPMLLAVGGVSGTGKSTLARNLAPTVGAVPGAVVLRSDVIRKQLWGVSPEERLPQSAYSAGFSAKVFQAIAERAEMILHAGHSVIADAVYGRPDERDTLENVARRANVAFTGFWLRAPQRVLESRIAARTNDASDATIEVLHAQLESMVPAEDWIAIEAEAEPAEVFAQAVRHLQQGESP
jgi:aminoglycoside phosphotransferase family enzyme/predicted kinase